MMGKDIYISYIYICIWYIYTHTYIYVKGHIYFERLCIYFYETFYSSFSKYIKGHEREMTKINLEGQAGTGMSLRQTAGTQTKLNDVFNSEVLQYVVLLDWVPIFRSRIQAKLYQRRNENSNFFFFMAYFFLLENLNYPSSLRLCLHSFLVQILRIQIIESTYSMRNYSDRAKFGPS